MGVWEKKHPYPHTPTPPYKKRSFHMSLSTKVTLSFLAGLFSAMLAWVVIDFNGFYSMSGSPESGSFFELFAQQAFVGAIFGIFVGIAIGFVNGISGGSSKLVQKNVCWGAIVGLCGGLIGLFFGQMFFGCLYKDPRAAVSFALFGPLYFIWDVIVRAIGWAFIGCFLGLAQGISSGSSKAARHGAIGGLIGGLLGGSLFEIVPYILPPGTQNPGVISRGISLTITGASIGLFIGLAENLLKQAWVRVVQGRNEGKEYIISKDRTTIGRDELSDIGLFGDRNVSPTHAMIDIQNNRHILRDAGSPLGTSVNSQRITEHVLRDGDLIQMGSMQLEFHDKATASKLPMPEDIAPMPAPQIPTMEGICPFCGTKKDPITGACECSVGTQPAASTSWQEPSPNTADIPRTLDGTGPRLIGISGPYAGKTFQLSSTSTSVGREQGKDIELPLDTTVSRRHARIENENDMFVIYDEGSSNGTKVNGARITSQMLSPWDIIEFGSSGFRFEQ